jgi:hypothetical protein
VRKSEFAIHGQFSIFDNNTKIKIMFLLPTALLLAPSIFKAGQGIAQLFKGKNADPKDFQKTPPAMQKAINQAQMEAQTSVAPGQRIAEENVRESAAQARKGASETGSASDIVRSATATQKGEDKAMARLTALGQENQQRQKNRLSNLQMRKGMLQEQQRQQFLNQKQRLLEAGQQNIFGSLDAATNIGLMSGQFGDSLRKDYVGMNTLGND